ncbi:MAG: DnaA/Hda family protein [Candidatus Poribacteria bacterium]|nr:DnaA/Hda family protein [Candidatus Poribacteria bacterium]MDE0502649.1 DnaA/Hda family protein [Candidatus Poribacteria bacterium]
MNHSDEARKRVPSQSEANESSPESQSPQLSQGVSTSRARSVSSSGLNPVLTLKRFVVGESNRTAYERAIDTINETDNLDGPILVFGGVGLGKTHLLHAIGNQFRANHPNKTVFCVPSEKFVRECIQSINHPHKYSVMRQRYYNLDLLLIDDLHFLTHEQRVQDEFVDLLSHISSQNCKLVCTCDRPPEFLKSYLAVADDFNYSAHVEILPPEFDLRVSILKQKLKERNWGPVPPRVIRFIAKHLTGHVRQLEGCLNRLMAEARLGSDLNVEVARRVIEGGHLSSNSPHHVSLERIQEAVSRYFQITLSELCSRRRGKRYVLPRQIAMYLARQLTTLSQKEISRGFGHSHHTTVVHSVQRIESLLDEDFLLSQSIASIKAELMRSAPS